MTSLHFSSTGTPDAKVSSAACWGNEGRERFVRPETLALRDQIAKRYKIEVALEQPDTTVEEYERLHDGPLYRTAPDRCCGDRKLAIIRRVLVNFDAWMSGIRRDQSEDRAAAPIVGWDHKCGAVEGVAGLVRACRRRRP